MFWGPSFWCVELKAAIFSHGPEESWRQSNTIKFPLSLFNSRQFLSLMSLHGFILSAAIISDFGHIPVAAFTAPLCVCVCVCVLGWLAAKSFALLSFYLCVQIWMCIVYLLWDPDKSCFFSCVFFYLYYPWFGQNLSGYVWFQSVPVITAGQRRTTASSLLFCWVAPHLTSLSSLFSFRSFCFLTHQRGVNMCRVFFVCIW